MLIWGGRLSRHPNTDQHETTPNACRAHCDALWMLFACMLLHCDIVVIVESCHIMNDDSCLVVWMGLFLSQNQLLRMMSMIHSHMMISRCLTRTWTTSFILVQIFKDMHWIMSPALFRGWYNITDLGSACIPNVHVHCECCSFGMAYSFVVVIHVFHSLTHSLTHSVLMLLKLCLFSCVIFVIVIMNI